MVWIIVVYEGNKNQFSYFELYCMCCTRVWVIYKRPSCRDIKETKFGINGVGWNNDEKSIKFMKFRRTKTCLYYTNYDILTQRDFFRIKLRESSLSFFIPFKLIYVKQAEVTTMVQFILLQITITVFFNTRASFNS